MENLEQPLDEDETAWLGEFLLDRRSRSKLRGTSSRLELYRFLIQVSGKNGLIEKYRINPATKL